MHMDLSTDDNGAISFQQLTPMHYQTVTSFYSLDFKMKNHLHIYPIDQKITHGQHLIQQHQTSISYIFQNRKNKK
jgi:hypothetical protein